MAARRSELWTGTILFAGTMLVVTSLFNIFEGFVALVQDERIVVLPERFVLVDLTSWGWTLLLFGVAMLAVGVGLLMAQTWARFAAVVVVGLHAVWQVVALGAFPIWALLMLALDTAVIFALTARWSSVRPELAPIDDMPPRAERQGYRSTPVA